MASLTLTESNYNHTIIEIHDLPTPAAIQEEPDNHHLSLPSSDHKTTDGDEKSESVAARDPLSLSQQAYQQPRPVTPVVQPFRPNESVPYHSLADSDGNKARVLTPPELSSSQLPEASSTSIRDYHSICYTLTLLIIAIILILSLVTSESLGPGFPILLTLGCVLFLGYLFDSKNSRTLTQLNRIISKESLQEYGQKLRTAETKLVLKMRCYHEEHKRDTKGDRGLREVTTFRTSEPLEVRPGGWLDRTDQIPPLNGITRIECKKELYWGTPEAKQVWENQKNLLILSNHKRDRCFDYSDHFTIDGFEEHFLLVPSDTVLPWWLNTTCFWFCTICLLSWPYRLWYDSRTSQLNFTFRKVAVL